MRDFVFGALGGDGGLAALFVASFVAATLVPFPSEALLYAQVRADPANVAVAILVATAGNTAGGMTTYLIGRLVPERTRRRLDPKSVDRVRRRGAPLLLLAWLPVVGDALVLAAGWLRVSAPAVLGFMAAGRLARYVAVAFLAV